tara:strand:+ start:415 stop:612 length:198 start_codon:yes stop_codon:yes gene_type:complete
MKLNQEAIETVQQLIRDLEIDLKAVKESHPLSEGRFEDVYLSINSAKDFIKEKEAIEIESQFDQI